MKREKSPEAIEWEKVEQFFIKNFTDGERPELDTILFLIGVQELGQGKRKFVKDDKLNLMHIAVCRLLEPLGYYRYKGVDSEGWPQFELTEKIPDLKANEQSLLIRRAIIEYFKTKELI